MATATGSTASPTLARETVWEVDAPDGSVLYLGCDLTLADEIYNGLPDGAHLHRLNLAQSAL